MNVYEAALNVYEESYRNILAYSEEIEKKEKEFIIMYIEHYFKRPLSEKEKQELMVLI